MVEHQLINKGINVKAVKTALYLIILLSSACVLIYGKHIFRTQPLFDIVDITVDTNIEFNQYTLQKGGRSRADNPYSYWEDDEDENYCPNCGCGMTFEHDSGVGFCINCESVH